MLSLHNSVIYSSVIFVHLRKLKKELFVNIMQDENKLLYIIPDF